MHMILSKKGIYLHFTPKKAVTWTEYKWIYAIWLDVRRIKQISSSELETLKNQKCIPRSGKDKTETNNCFFVQNAFSFIIIW